MRQTLVRWLAGRTVEQLAALMDARPFVSEFGGPPRTLEQLAERLLQPYAVEDSLERVDQQELQVLSAAVALAAHREGEAPRIHPRVAEKELLAQFAPDDAAAAGEVLVRMREKLLFFPGEPGEVVLHQMLMAAMDVRVYRPRTVDAALTEAFNKPEVQRVARGLGLPDAGNRDAVQERVVAWLTEPVLVRSLLAGAPPEATALLEQAVAEVAPVRTGRFTGYGRYRFADTGSGDTGVDWLAERGLLLPLDEELVEVPLEVVEAVRGPLWLRLTPAAPVPATVPVRPVRVRHEAQAALSAAVLKVENLGAALEGRPAAIRKAGGLAVRETRRLAKAMGVPEEEARLWVDLATMSGLLGIRRTPSPEPRRGSRGGRVPQGESVLLPTARFDAWLRLPPARRPAPLLRAWAAHEDVVTWWPDPHTPPVALALPQDRMAVELRRAVLRVLAALPDDRGCDLTHPRVLEELADAAAFHRPLALFTDPAVRLEATLKEAALLGVVAHGALTPLGHTVWAMLEAGPDDGASGGPDEQGMLEALDGLLPEAVARAVFQADLTVVVPGVPAPELARLLGSVAERESQGHAVVWRITPQTVRRALDAGAGARELLERLAGFSSGALPQPLTYLVTDLARRHGSVRVVRSGCCLRAPDEALLKEIAAHTALRDLGLRLIAPTVLISARPVAQTLEALRGAGYAPVLEAESGDTVIERVPLERAPSEPPPFVRTRLDGLAVARELCGK